MLLKLYNTRTRTKEIFHPLKQDHVGLYVCGPTVYDRAHLGNARPVVVFDCLFRLLKQLYPSVTYVRNITDVDDKINAASLARGLSIAQITEETTHAFHADMAALGALLPTHEPRATNHISVMIRMIQQLIERGHAYEAEGHVLFDVATYQAYGALSKRSLDDMIAGARVEIAPYKKSAADFVLWKPSSADLPGWDSPWGRGRPGWHIECSAMSATYLGTVFDIHAGGIDLVFPHHENEIAQSCCAHGTDKMAQFWLHNGHLTVDRNKMSKSLGNFLTVNTLLQEHAGETIRLALLMTHYRQPLDWNDTILQQAKQTLDRWYIVAQEAPEESAPPLHDVMIALADDLNTPLALSLLHQKVHQFHKTESSKEKAKIAASLKATGYFLGLLQDDPQRWLQRNTTDTAWINSEISKRQAAKKIRDFKIADQIRAELLSKGIILEDTPQGTIWRSI